jgi:hypothetical protein
VCCIGVRQFRSSKKKFTCSFPARSFSEPCSMPPFHSGNFASSLNASVSESVSVHGHPAGSGFRALDCSNTRLTIFPV